MTSQQLLKMMDARMDRMEAKIDKVSADTAKIRENMVDLRVKVAIFGGAAGLIVSAIFAFLVRYWT